MITVFLSRYVKSSDSRGGFGRTGGYDSGVGRRNDRFNGRVEKNGFGSGRNKSGLDDQQLRRIDWNLEDLAPLRKNFYKPSSSVLDRSRSEIENFHHKHEITVRGLEAPQTIFEFNEVGFPSYLTTALTHQGFKQPTVIQSLSWPIALAGRDFVGIASTGSGNINYQERSWKAVKINLFPLFLKGKTLGFLLPALVHITHQEKLQRGDGPIALVLAPTRELAQQIQAVATEYGKRIGIRNTCVFGGGKHYYLLTN